jgi:hypothetical protein
MSAVGPSCPAKKRSTCASAHRRGRHGAPPSTTACVAAAARELRQQERRRRHRRVRQDLRATQRVVDGGQQQHRPPDRRQERTAALGRVVVGPVAKPVRRRRDHVVEPRERAAAAQRVEIEATRMLGVLLPRLRQQRAQEVARDRAAVALVALPRTNAQIERRRHRRRGDDGRGRAGALFAEPLQQHVAAERVAERQQRGARKSLAERAHDEVEVGGLAAVVGAARAIEHAATRPELEHGEAPAARRGQRRRRAHVARVAAALEAVQHQHERRARVRDVDEVHTQRIAIGRGPGLGPQRRRRVLRAHRGDGLLQAGAGPPDRPERHSGEGLQGALLGNGGHGPAQPNERERGARRAIAGSQPRCRADRPGPDSRTCPPAPVRFAV